MAALAVRLLITRGAQYLVHCGDVGSEQVLDAMAGHPAMFVFGNNDWDRHPLEAYARILGIECGNEEGALSFDDKRAIVTHGDDPLIINRIFEAQSIDYLFVGHTHEKMDARKGRIRVINPGALYRARQKTVALLDTVTDNLEFLMVDAVKPA